MLYPKNYQELAQQIIELLQNDSKRKKFGENARKRAIKIYDIDKVAQVWTDFLESCSIVNE